jgi:hypothetical protein
VVALRIDVVYASEPKRSIRRERAAAGDLPPSQKAREQKHLVRSFMRVMLTAVLLLSVVFGGAVIASESGLLRQRDGKAGTISPLGGEESIYTDPHGMGGVTHEGSGLPSHTFSGPHGAEPGSVTPFGNPHPPNRLTPPPLLPLNPRGMGMPQPETPRSIPGLPGSPSGRGSR